MNAQRKASIRNTLWNAQGGLCCYCENGMAMQGTRRADEGARLGISQRQVTKRRATLEHLCRIADGGTGRRDNLALACQECNSSRGERDWLTYKSLRMGEIVEV